MKFKINTIVVFIITNLIGMVYMYNNKFQKLQLISKWVILFILEDTSMDIHGLQSATGITSYITPPSIKFNRYSLCLFKNAHCFST